MVNEDNSCENTYLRAVQEIVMRSEATRLAQNQAPRTTVMRKIDRERGEYLSVTRNVFLCDEYMAVEFDLTVDAQVKYIAEFYGSIGFALSATDVEIFHNQLTSLFGGIIPMLRLYDWIASPDPKKEYTEFPPKEPIPLFVYRKDQIIPQKEREFATTFMEAMRRLDIAVFTAYVAIGGDCDD